VAHVVDDQHESAADDTHPSVDEAMSDASGDMAKTPSEDDPTSEAVVGEAGAGAGVTEGSADDAMSDAASDTEKSPDAEDERL